MNNNDHKTGTLPQSAPLAAAYVPVQRAARPSYEANEALSRGTLFPGLDLPFMNSINGLQPDSALSELQAICFAAHELELYLDTHRDDRRAFEALKSFLALKQEAQNRYIQKYGPLRKEDLIDLEGFSWTEDPWPWDYREA
ncbi:MAG: spore coat protein CotJB [Eubacteriales bacterium]|nr:spore coat protein CotJB [Eubacteriales bacterium]